MICPACHGNGYIRLRKTGHRPCFNCGGSGVASCCDGAVPEDEDVIADAAAYAVCYKPTDFEKNGET